MKIKYFFMIPLFTLIGLSTLTSNTFAYEEVFNTEVDQVANTPNVTITKLPNGSMNRTMAVPGDSNITRSVVVNSAGKIESYVLNTKQPDGTTKVEVIEEDGTTHTATIGANGAVTGDASATAYLSAIAAGTSQKETITSEMVPGGNCVCISGGTPGAAGVACTGAVAERKYKCTTGEGISGFEEMFKNIVNYIVKIVLLLSVLAVTGIGIAWTFAGGDDIKLKTTIKGWAMNVVAGIIILFLFGLILSFLAPGVYQF